VPIDKPGFYVLELASPALGRSLLAKPSSMYVRTTVLVTNLGVHLKQGRENNLVWVTTLDKGKPVPNAQIRVSDCNGDEIAAGKTDAQGLLKIDGPFEPQRECHTSERGFDDYFVSARVDDPKTGPDMAFVSSNWNRGIEAWRFNVPTDTDSAPTVRAHTVFDRTLLRAGETVSMKHFVRTETLQSLAFPAQYPSRVTIRHLGSDQTYKLPLTWSADHSADTQFTLPQAAKLGEYSVTLEGGPDDAPTSSYYSGSFRVEAFRLPVLKGTIGARDAQKSPLVAVKEAPLAVQIDYVSGGGASNLPVQVSALMKWASPPFADRFEDFSFAPYRPERSDGNADDDAQDGDNTPAANDDPDATRLIADKLPLTLDRNGAGSVTLKGLPDVDAPKRVALEATFADPNGEVQTIRGDTILWPAAVVAGIKAGHWVSVGQRAGAGARGRPAGQAARVGADRDQGRRARHDVVAQADGRRLLRVRQQERHARARRAVLGQDRRQGPHGLRREARTGRQRAADRGREGRRRPRVERGDVGVGHARGRPVVRRRQHRPDRRDPREDLVRAGRNRALPGAHAVPLRHRAGRGRTRRRDGDAHRRAERQEPDRRPEGRRIVGAERLRVGARAARPDTRSAVVLVLHVGLEGAGRMGARSGRKAATTRRRPRSSICRNRRSATASAKSRSARPCIASA
jgi:hypothetical protein